MTYWRRNNLKKSIASRHKSKSNERRLCCSSELTETVSNWQGEPKVVPFDAASIEDVRLERNNGTNKGAWGMPRLSEAKKDVTSCDKPWRGANTH